MKVRMVSKIILYFLFILTVCLYLFLMISEIDMWFKIEFTFCLILISILLLKYRWDERYGVFK